MCGTTEPRTQLPLASAAQHACACCSPAADTAADASASGAAVQASGTQYVLEGLTCGHCVQTVEKAVSAVAGVESATVDLVPGGASQLRVTGTAGREELAKAVRSSGYVMAGSN
ncbi:heavy-metal-associated domain-containing protein [Arthrobacter sp. FW306-05-C]|uniref:heavy-metal-associated domain-containing protein n=1 Tax=Arthrobacter sp. FW306-05-C TaxID=2879620 RepID=UPI001F2EFFFE|nr:heavy-metal-associated domain-containing protein [Arthrobacter sp. FW306-05-C]UKA68435.1 heavy-metal-associated domain-containing protein [Arthrobacter sp. FW306-05-C]